MDAVAFDLHHLELTELAALIRAREISSVPVTRAQFDRIASVDATLRSYALVMTDVAIGQANTADREIAAGFYRGPLHDLPIAVKDLCWTKGFPTAAGMPIYKHFRPDDDATANGMNRAEELAAHRAGQRCLVDYGVCVCTRKAKPSLSC
jgi:amidase